MTARAANADSVSSRAIGYSLLGHVLVIAIAAGSMLFTRRPPLVQNVIQTQLVRLGKNRPDWLPRKEEAPQAKSEAVAISDAKAIALEKKANKAENKAKFEDVMKRLEQIEKKEDYKGKGDERGSKEGTVSDFTLQTLGSQYATDLVRKIHPNYDLPSVIPTDVAARLQASVVLYIAPDGRLIRTEFEQRSGNTLFDDALIKAIHVSSPLPPPSPQLREQVARDGIAILFRGK